MNIEYENGKYRFRVNGSSIQCKGDELRDNIKKYGIRDFSIVIYSTAKVEIERVEEIANNIRLEYKVN